ncbi:MAG: adenosine deaminase [Erysipelotrichaceae bacterium]|nr:adenosine deaminase [Erysipelotrichaceae bacterium]
MEERKIPDCLIDLHLHLDGSLDIDTVEQLSLIQNIEIPTDEEELQKEITVSPDCKDLNEYLEKFKFPLKLLQTPAALKLAVYQLVEKLKSEGLIYAEIRFAPMLHTEKGMTIEEVVDVTSNAIRYADMKANLILCCYRGASEQDNREVIRVAKQYLGKGVCAIDLAGAEALFPNEMYKYCFDYAQELGVPYTIHSGEAAGPQSVWKALEYGTKRIGHGVRSCEDDDLMDVLAERKITLEMCPTSNLHTCVFPSLDRYPIRTFLEKGIRVTVNTDNMTVSGTTVRQEFEKLIDQFDLSDDEIRKMLINSAEAAFISDQEKEELKRVINAAFAA